MSKPLLSDVSFVRLSLSESSGDRVKLRGEFAKCGIATENKRVYPKGVWEKEIKRIGKALKERRVFGEVDHPSDGQTKLARVSHIVTDLSIKDGLVIGEAEIMPTEAGKNLLALLKANVPVGVSSRGFGSVKTNESGQDVVQEDYKLVTFDFVADPADVDAYPQVAESRGLFEGVEFDVDDEQEKAIAFARRIEAEKAGKKQNGDLREEFAKEILSNLSTMRSEVRDQVRKELMEDPTVAKAKQVLDEVRMVLRPYLLPEDAAEIVAGKDTEIRDLKKQLAERDLKLKDLEAENVSLVGMAKEVGYRFYLERMISNDPDADTIRNLVGDLKKVENSDALKARVAEVKAELGRKTKVAVEHKAKEVAEARSSEQKVRSVVESKLAQIEKRMAAEQEKREELEAALSEALRANKELSTRMYAEERLANHPKAGKLRNLVESARPANRSVVDALLESEREPVMDSDDLQGVRARIRSRMNGGLEHSPQLSESSNPASRMRRAGAEPENYQGLGTSIDTLKRLSGISE